MYFLLYVLICAWIINSPVRKEPSCESSFRGKVIFQGNDLSINSFYILDKAYQNAGKDTGYNRYGNDSGNNNFWLIEVEKPVAGFFRKAVLLSNDFRTFIDDFNSQRISVQTCKSDGKDFLILAKTTFLSVIEIILKIC